jgi:ribosomal protein S18 acetylase RimI-like enzyme
METLLDWRMEVLDHVFPGRDLSGLRAASRRYYQGQLGSGHIACFALEEPGNPAGEQEAGSAGDWKERIIGCGGICLQQEMPSPDNPSGRCGYLMNIYVRPKHRHQGHARGMVDWLMDQARAWGAEKIWLEASEEGRPLYETLGFTDLPAIMAVEPNRTDERPATVQPAGGGTEHDGNSEAF